MRDEGHLFIPADLQRASAELCITANCAVEQKKGPGRTETSLGSPRTHFFHPNEPFSPASPQRALSLQRELRHLLSYPQHT